MEINYTILAYAIFAIVITFSLMNYLYRSGRVVAAVSTFLLFLTIFIFFGIRWFQNNALGVADPRSGPWPPVINTCPDYLTYFRRPLSAGGFEDACIDAIGVSGIIGTARALKVWSSDTLNAANPPTEANYYFPYTYKPGLAKEKLDELALKAAEYGLTWEGIYDGTGSVVGAAPAGAAPATPSCPST